jgi:xanthine dehydrogenase accessory factor
MKPTSKDPLKPFKFLGETRLENARTLNMFDEFLSRTNVLRSAELPFAIAIVVRYQPPVSGKPGDKAIIQADGSIWGWIGGGCVQPLVVREALKAIEEEKPRLLRIGPSRDAKSEEGIVNYPMTCHGGGALDIYVEPVLSKPHLLIIGRSLVAQTLCRLGKTVGYKVTIAGAADNRDRFSGADLILEELDLQQVRITPRTYIVISTQGEHDETALEQAVRSEARYIAFVASHTKAKKVFEFLAENGIPPDRLARVRAPAGLHLGSLSPEEIAVSILAEIVQIRKEQTVPADAGSAPETNLELMEVKDPVCGMMVREHEARFTSGYGGQIYYFCCAGCKQAFDKQPEAFLNALVSNL